MMAATPVTVDGGASVRRAIAIHERPQASDSVGAMRPRSHTARATPTRPATAMTATAHASGARPNPSNPAATSTAVMFAAVATQVQPR